MNQLNLSLKSNKNKEELVFNGRIYQMYYKNEQNGIILPIDYRN